MQSGELALVSTKSRSTIKNWFASLGPIININYSPCGNFLMSLSTQ